MIFRPNYNHKIKNKFSTPKSRKRNKRAISPIQDDQSTPTSKTKKAKKKLNFDKEKGKGKDSPENKNILNLPYSDSESEEEQATDQGADLADQVASGYEDLPSPTPKEDQDQQVAEVSSSKPKQCRSQKVSQLLR